jgi:hypothetical protein
MLNKKIMTNDQYEKAEKIKEDGVGRLLGFNWIILPEAMPEVAPGIRGYFAVNSRGIVFKTRPIVQARVAVRHDRSDAPQAYYSEELGAVRMIDEAVVQINVALADPDL